MKKIVSLFILVLLMVSCGKKEDFYLEYKGNTMKLDAVYSTSVYGQYNDFFESENCAFGNRDITYMYDDIEVEAYGNSKNELIVYRIKFTNENVKTNEGIAIYDEMKDAIDIYGDDYVQVGNKYTYNHGNTSLTFLTDNNIIESIEYQLNNLN